MAKNLKVLIYMVIFLNIKIRVLQKANKAFNKRRRAKKTRIRDKKLLIILNAINLINSKNVNTQL